MVGKREVLIRFEECEKGGRPNTMWQRIGAGNNHKESVALAQVYVAAVARRQKGRRCTLLEVFKSIYP
jgi:hypothetical protein